MSLVYFYTLTFAEIFLRCFSHSVRLRVLVIGFFAVSLETDVKGNISTNFTNMPTAFH